MADAFTLVCGSGGVAGVAWSVGLFAGLLERGVLDARRAQTLIGTSAGAVVAAVLAAGVDPRELIEQTRAQRPDPRFERYFTGIDQAIALELFSAWSGAAEMTPEVGARIGALAARASNRDPEEWVERSMTAVPPVSWHGSRLRIVAVSAGTGERVVWDGGSGIPIERAIAASSAVPGLVPPIPFGDDRFIDGGVWSSTSADLALDAPAETVLVTVPQARMGLLQQTSMRALERERAQLEAAGRRVLVLTPSEGFEELAMRSMSQKVRDPAAELGRSDAAAAAGLLADAEFDAQVGPGARGSL